MTGPPTFHRRAVAVGLAAGAFAASSAASAARRPTAREIVARIQAACAREGVAWASATVDTFKFGDPDTPITGVVSTFMGTLELLREAAARGANLIVSHEPVFWNHRDDTHDAQDDPVYRAKTRFAAQHGMVIWRFHDHWHRLRPEPMSTAFAERLGWAGQLVPGGPTGFSRRFERPETSLRRLTQEISARLPTHSLRVVGDPDLPVRRVATVGHGVTEVVMALETNDVVIAPEIREWDSAEYVRDLVRLGQRKALIMLAHERGEEDGASRCADWLRGFVGDVPVRFISSGEPFRTLGFVGRR